MEGEGREDLSISFFFRSTGSLIHRAALRFSQNYSAPTARMYRTMPIRHVLYVYRPSNTFFARARAPDIIIMPKLKTCIGQLFIRAASAGTNDNVRMDDRGCLD